MALGLIFLVMFTCATAVEVLHLSEGEICNDSFPPSYCVYYSKCPGLKKAIKNKEYPEICSFKGRTNPVICCPPEKTESELTQPEHNQITNFSDFTESRLNVVYNEEAVSKIRKSKAQEMCQKYARYVWRRIPAPTLVVEDETRAFCGRSETTLLLGGSQAGPREFPHMALIGYGDKSNIEWLCSGSLISERFILSAAHCTSPPSTYLMRQAKWAKLGDLDLSTDNDNAQPVTIKITEMINHPEFNLKYPYHDIALYKLERDAPLGIYIRPICLNTEVITRPTAVATGWGRTDFVDHPREQMLKVTLNVISNKQCNDTYNKQVSSNRSHSKVSNYTICAGGNTGKEMCMGDSGGPLQIALETPYCMYSIIGVTSFGGGCGSSRVPAVFTNVARYVKWIEGIVWPE